MSFLTVTATGVATLGVIAATYQAFFAKKYPGEKNPYKFASCETKGNTQEKKYDYVIIGGGTAGCVLASRLTEDPNVSVLVLEAGDVGSKELFSNIPSGFGRLFKTAGDWDFRTEPEKHISNRELYWPRGKFLGGSSSINAMCYTRCASSNYDEWASLGATGWDFSTLFPYFVKAETFNDTNKEWPLPSKSRAAHGTKGPWQTSYTNHFDPTSAAWMQDCQKAGIPLNEDINVPENTSIGITRLQTFTKAGVRSSAATGYITDEVAKRKNLTIGLGAHVTRILFEQGNETRAVGVQFKNNKDGPVFRVHAAKEVLLCAGAVQSPQILMLSGVGSAADLRKHNIPVVLDLPAVGQNLQDHPGGSLVFKSRAKGIQEATDSLRSIPMLAEWLTRGTGVLTSNLAETATFVKYEPTPEDIARGYVPSSKDCPDIEIIFAACAFYNHGLPPAVPLDRYLTMYPVLLTTQSRGTIELRSADPFEKPVINANYLEHWQDRRILGKAFKIARDIATLQDGNIHAMITGKGMLFPDFGKPIEEVTDEDIDAILDHMVETLYHPSSTCTMGQVNDPNTVVDPSLRVKGIQGLRVVDASVFPKLVAGHPCAAVIAVAERAADLIKGHAN